MTTTIKWDVNDRGDIWRLYIDRKLCFSLTYLGLDRAANWADRKQRWKVQDHTQVEGANDIPEFDDCYAAKAWVDTIVRLT